MMPGPIVSAVTDRTRIVFICSPNNPTGSIIPSAQMAELVNSIPSHVLIVADEVYHHFNTDIDYPDTLGHVMDGKRIIIVHSFSKAYGLAGGRLGYGIGPPDIIENISRFRLPFHINNITLQGGLAALGDAAHLESTVDVVVTGRQWLYEQLGGLGTEVWPSQGNFVLFKTAGRAEEVCEGLLNHGIIIRPMDLFYLPGFLRVSVGWKKENKRFIASLSNVLSAIQTN